MLKNRKLYYPFALVTVLSSAFAYIFTSLANNPNLFRVWGATGVRTVLDFGFYVVMIAVVIMIFYANSFVMKNRSKEIGLYSVLGMDKKHLLLMTLVETLFFAVSSLFLGIVTGALLDKLFYAILLKVMKMDVLLVSSFQWSTVFTILEYFGAIFVLIWLLNAGKLGFSTSLNLVRDKRKGEKNGRFLWVQTFLGLVILGIAYWLAQDIKAPLQAMNNFFIAVLMVIVATYILFNVGIISFLHFLKNRPNYYYKPVNFISVSNLIFRMQKNAMGLATISILSTMVLVTMVGAINIYAGAENYIAKQYPNDFYIELEPKANENGKVTAGQAEADACIRESLAKGPLKDAKLTQFQYQAAFLKTLSGNTISAYENGQISEDGGGDSSGVGYLIAIHQSDYQKMTGKKTSLTGKEILLYTRGKSMDSTKPLTINDKDFHIKEVLKEDFTNLKIPTNMSLLVETTVVVVLSDDVQLLPANNSHYYTGIDTDLSLKEQDVAYGKLSRDFMPDADKEFPFTNWFIASRGNFSYSFMRLLARLSLLEVFYH